MDSFFYWFEVKSTYLFQHSRLSVHILSWRPGNCPLPIPAVMHLKMALVKVAWYVCKRAKYVFWIALRFLEFIRIKLCSLRYEARQSRVIYLCISKLTSLFHHFSSIGPKHLCASAHLGCPQEVSAY